MERKTKTVSLYLIITVLSNLLECKSIHLTVFNVVILHHSVCPLVFPSVSSVVKECGNLIHNQTACCKAIKSYVSYLQEQSFVTNLQALKCAASLGKKLQNANVSKDVYSLCHISLKDFSLQGWHCYISIA